MSHLVLSREVYSPLDRTYDYVSDVTSSPEWWSNVVDVQRLDGSAPGPLREGERFAVRYHMLGRQLNGLLTIKEVVPGSRFSYDVEGQITAHFRWDFTATAKTRTRAIVTIDYEPPGLLGKAFDALFIERRNQADGEHAMDQLKDHLEAEVMSRIDAGVV